MAVNMVKLQDYYIATFTGKTPSPAAKAAFEAAGSTAKRVASRTARKHVNSTPDTDSKSWRENVQHKLREIGISPLKNKTNPKKQSSDSNAEKDEIKNKGKGRGKQTNPFNKRGGTNLERLAKSTEAAKNRPGSNKGIGKKAEAKPQRPKRSKGENAEYGGRTSMDGKTPPKPTPNPKTERQRQKELNRSPAAIKARKEAYSKKNSLSGNSINNEQKMEKRLKNKQFASGAGSRKNTSGSTDARNNVITRTLGKLFNDKRSQAEKTKTRKDNQAFWDDNGPDK